MVKIYAILTLFALIGLTNAGKVHWFATLKKNVQEMKETLSEDQLAGINSMRKRIGQFPGVHFDEPIFKFKVVHLYTAIGEYLDEKQHFRGNYNMINEKEGFEIYKREFKERITKPCETFDEIMHPSLAYFYMNKIFGGIKFSDVQEGDKDELEMLLDAGFCHRLMKNTIRKTMDESYKLLMKSNNKSHEKLVRKKRGLLKHRKRNNSIWKFQKSLLRLP